MEDNGTVSKVSENFFAGLKVCERDCQNYNKIKLLLVLFILENEHCVIFFKILQVLHEPVIVERGREGVIQLQLTVPFGCFMYYDGDEKKVSPCSLHVELKNQQYIECGGIQSQSLCGTIFLNENWNAVKKVVVRHMNDVNYQVPAMHLVKFFTLQMESHSIWSNVEIPEVKVNLHENSD